MANTFHILSLFALVVSVYAVDPRLDHIFVFEGGFLDIDCAGGDQAPILNYRQRPDSSEHKTIFYGEINRDKEYADIIPVKKDGNDVHYEIKSAKLSQGGEYECDWSSDKDEWNHYVNVVDYDTISCPTFTNPITENTVIPGLECSIVKAGAIVEEFINSTEKMNLKFDILDSAGNPVKVVYEEVYEKMTAKVDGLMLTRKQHGTKLVCQFTDIHGNVSKCESNEAVVNWPAEGVAVEAPDMAVIGESFNASCSFDDPGNPQQTPVLMINGEEKADGPSVGATKEHGAQVNVTCKAGEVVKTKAVLLHFGPESAKASVEKLELMDGDKMEFSCSAPEETFPAVEIVYKIGDMEIEPNATAGPHHHGKSIDCFVINTVSKQQAKASIPLNVKFSPKSVAGLKTLEEDLDAPVELDCVVAANPLPTYSWFFTKKDAQNATQLSESGSKLKIEKLSSEDVGAYKCHAINEFGRAIVQFDLSEKAKTGGNPAAIAIPIIIVLIIIIAVIIAIFLMKKRNANAGPEEKEKEMEQGDLIEDENTRKDGPVASEEDDKESDDEKKPIDSKDSTPSPTEENKDSQPENPEKANVSESPV